ncbi:MAG: hypothetical protein MUF30_06815 [Burkholderiales bacterium]|nr:hypothetical protein [Burkholderiales bacterium]
MTPRPALPPAPAPLTLYVSKVRTGLVLFAAVGGGLHGIFGAYYASFLFAREGPAHTLFTVMFAAPIALLAGTFAWDAARGFFWRGPALELDHDGITDHRAEPPFVAWTDTREVFLGRQNTRLVLSVNFRTDAIAADYPRLLSPFAIVRKFFGMAGQWNLRLGYLACKPREVIAAAEALRRHALVADARARNQATSVVRAGSPSPVER